MSLILDASVCIAWMNKNEVTPAIVQVFDRVTREAAWVPSLWWLEVANVLQVGIRRKQYGVMEREAYLSLLSGLTLRTDQSTDVKAWTDTLALSDRHDLTAYDAAYLELAVRRQLPLATLDRELRTACVAERVDVLGI